MRRAGEAPGRIADAEFAAGMKELFVEWDLDKNGTLDQREVAADVHKLTLAGSLCE